MTIILALNVPLEPVLGNTGGTWTFSVTRNQIITDAMLDLGLIGENEVPTSQEITDCAFKLNMLVKQWMGKQDFAPGLKMWTRQRGDLFLGAEIFQYSLGPSGGNWAGGVTGGANNFNQTQTTAVTLSGANTLTPTSLTAINVNDYVGVQTSSDIFWTTVESIDSGAGTFDTVDNMPSDIGIGAYIWNYTTKAQQPLEIVTSILRDTNYNDIPQRKMTIEEYEVLPTKTSPDFVSDPMAFYYEFQLGNGNYYIDCGGAQDVTKHLHIVYLRAVSDFDNPGDSPEYPQQWYRALCWGLARDIAPMFDSEWTQTMENNYQDALAMAKETVPETTAMYFRPGEYQ